MKKGTNETENPFEEVRKTQKKICSRAMISTVLISLALIAFDEKAMAKGLILGTLLSVINFLVMARSIPKSLGKTPAKARAIGFMSVLGRYGILAIPLVAGMKMDTVSFWAAVVGIFAVQIVILIDYTLINRMKT